MSLFLCSLWAFHIEIICNTDNDSKYQENLQFCASELELKQQKTENEKQFLTQTEKNGAESRADICLVKREWMVSDAEDTNQLYRTIIAATPARRGSAECRKVQLE